MQSQNHHAGKQSLGPPKGHIDAEKRGQKTVRGAGDGIGVEQIAPHHGQRPLGHDVGEDENGADIFSPCHVGAGDQKSYGAAKHDGDCAGAHCQIDCVQQGTPQVGLGHLSGEQIHIVHCGIAADSAGQILVNGAGVDLKGILYDGNDRRHCGKGQHNAKEQQDHVIWLGEEGHDLIAPNTETVLIESRLLHVSLLSKHPNRADPSE